MAIIADCYRRMNQDLQPQLEQMENVNDILSQKYTATSHTTITGRIFYTTSFQDRLSHILDMPWPAHSQISYSHITFLPKKLYLCQCVSLHLCVHMHTCVRERGVQHCIIDDTTRRTPENLQ
jgi:hypothetical protein